MRRRPQPAPARPGKTEHQGQKDTRLRPRHSEGERPLGVSYGFALKRRTRPRREAADSALARQGKAKQRSYTFECEAVSGQKAGFRFLFDGAIEHEHLLRAMDALVEHQDEVEVVLVSLLRPWVDQDLAVVFYDMTTIGAAGLSDEVGDVRQFGMCLSKVSSLDRSCRVWCKPQRVCRCTTRSSTATRSRCRP